MDGKVATDDETFPISERRADYIRPGKSHEQTIVTLQLFILYFKTVLRFVGRVVHCKTLAAEFTSSNVPFLSRLKTNMAATSHVTTTTCVTCPSYSGDTWGRRRCCSPLTARVLGTSSAAPYRVFMRLWTLVQVTT